MKKLFPVFLFVFFLSSCIKVEPVSPVPEIKFKSFEYDYIYNEELDQSLYTRVLEFDFIDGDADLGVYDADQADSSLPIEYRYGIFIHFFEKVGADYIERFFTTDSLGYVSRDSLSIQTILVDSSWADSILVDTVWKDTTYTKVVEKVDTTIVEYFEDTLYVDTDYFHQQFPYSDKLERVGQNKTVKGTVRVGILFPAKLPYDTMRLEFYIRDRAMNKSNVEVTNDFTNEPVGGIMGIQ
jgi:hypothetical protein